MSQSLSEFAMWSGLQRRVASPAFRRAELTAIMGGIELDLRQAGTENGEAVIDVFVMWGGIEITVPPDWAVSNQVTPILGGSEDKSTGTQQSRNRLIVKVGDHGRRGHQDLACASDLGDQLRLRHPGQRGHSRARCSRSSFA